VRPSVYVLPVLPVLRRALVLQLCLPRVSCLYVCLAGRKPSCASVCLPGTARSRWCAPRAAWLTPSRTLTAPRTATATASPLTVSRAAARCSEVRRGAFGRAERTGCSCHAANWQSGGAALRKRDTCRRDKCQRSGRGTRAGATSVSTQEEGHVPPRQVSALRKRDTCRRDECQPQALRDASQALTRPARTEPSTARWCTTRTDPSGGPSFRRASWGSTSAGSRYTQTDRQVDRRVAGRQARMVWRRTDGWDGWADR
jgi:hypothetical protein